MSDEKRTPVFWGSPDDETLSFTDPDDYLTDYFDNDYLLDDPPEDEIVVVGYARMVLSAVAVDYAVENLLEDLDAEYGDPDDDPTEISEGMKAAMDKLEAAIIKDYEVWACEEVERISVNVAEWAARTGYDFGKGKVDPGIR